MLFKQGDDVHNIYLGWTSELNAKSTDLFPILEGFPKGFQTDTDMSSRKKGKVSKTRKNISRIMKIINVRDNFFDFR